MFLAKLFIPLQERGHENEFLFHPPAKIDGPKAFRGLVHARRILF
jgi:hypothetical protein